MIESVMRLAILSNVTVEILAGMLKKEHDVWIPPGFGAWMETALKPPAEMVGFAPEAVVLLLDSSHMAFDAGDVRAAKSALEDAFPFATVLIPDLEDLSDACGDFYDERMWKLASMPWSLKGMRSIQAEIGRLSLMMKGGRKKVLALDFDNTLWAGVIGEDGIDGIRPYREFQEGLRGLRENGVLLVGLSKNNAADVEPVWNDSRMALGRDDFVALRIDWNGKAENLSDVAKELNIGSDSFVFVDDNPVERERMKALRPEVIVPDFPADESGRVKFLRRITRLYFPEMRLTEEDRRKTALYREEAERKEFAACLSVDEYLKGLEIWTDIHPVRADEIARVAQLSQKTNQFNVLTNRYSVDEVARFASDPGRLLVAVRSGDRFGEQGLVAFVQATIDGERAEIVDWVMSCRAMNRGLEFTVEEQVERMLSARGVTSVAASWRKTPKNAPVAHLFEAFGFALCEGDADFKRYALRLPRVDKTRSCEWIAVR